MLTGNSWIITENDVEALNQRKKFAEELVVNAYITYGISLLKSLCQRYLVGAIINSLT